MSTDHDPVYVRGLRAENFLRLELVDVQLGPGLTLVTGQNAQGKSSLLKAIMAALGGAKALPAQPVRVGSDHAAIDLDLGDMLVHRDIDPDGGGKLTVTSKDGASVFKRPQQILDALVGQFAFDPLELLRLKPAQRLATVRQLAGVDTSATDAEIKRLREQRTLVGRDHNLLQGQLSGCTVPADPVPAPAPAVIPPRVSVADLAAQQHAAMKQQRDNAIVRTALAGHEICVEQYAEEVEELRQRLAEAEELLARAQQLVAEYQAKVTALVDPDVDEIAVRLSNAESQNHVAEAAEKAEERRQHEHREQVAYRALALNARQQKAAEVQAKGQEYDLLTAAITAREQAKVDLLASATFPVPGMGFGDEDITFNGLPWAQCSASEQLRICLATGAALNPRLRFIASEAGNDLDLPRLREMAAWALEHDMQLLLERVASETPVGLVIDCGRVVGDHRAPAPPAAAAAAP